MQAALDATTHALAVADIDPNECARRFFRDVPAWVIDESPELRARFHELRKVALDYLKERAADDAEIAARLFEELTADPALQTMFGQSKKS
jgi:hypothetical protein